MAWFTSPSKALKPAADPTTLGHTQLTAPGPTTLAAPAPPDPTLAASTAVGQAQLAAAKQRKRATGGAASTPSSIAAPTAVTTPKTLLGY